MTASERLRQDGLGRADFKRAELVDSISDSIREYGSASFVIGTHVATDLDRKTIGDCNPYNRRLFTQTVYEEGFKSERRFNSYGVESIRVYL